MRHVNHFGTIGEAEYSNALYIWRALDERDGAKIWYFWRLEGGRLEWLR
jgi:hypothetical protein